MDLPKDYIERVYAGVLGKIIGVYLGRPFEGWTFEKIMSELGEINYYVHEKRNVPLIVTDDDIAGTFTFLRAFPDYDNDPNLSAANIGQTWLNYLIEKKTVLWWGGMGNSTEHTAYLRLKNGIQAPLSGSRKLNGKTVSEQIGAQIFIDGWAMVCPGDPERAADLAGRASSVSHDGEAIYGAQVIAAMESQAFIEPNPYKLIEIALPLIPNNSIIYRLINDLLQWRAKEPDWRNTRLRIAEKYGYDKYGGNCHIVPNHALILLGLLYGDDQFQKTLMITNTSGWDTDCNSGNIGCLMGIKNGLAGIDCGPDWRGPVADRMYLSTADGGRAISDAVIETYQIVNIGRSLVGLQSLAPKSGARFHFELPGSTQGFMVDESSDCRNTLVLENVPGHSLSGSRSLALHYRHLASGRFARAKTLTFIPMDVKMPGSYELIASPTLYPGQKIQARISADKQNKSPISIRLYVNRYDSSNQFFTHFGPEITLSADQDYEMEWQVDDKSGHPMAEIGLELRSVEPGSGVVYLDYLTWGGVPDYWFRRPDNGGMMWRKAWVNAIDSWEPHYPETYRLVQNEGRGMIIQGCREWGNYCFEAEIKPHLLEDCGIGIHVQGLKRYYALLLQKNSKVQLVKMLDKERVLAETTLEWVPERTYRLCLKAEGNHLVASIDNAVIFDVVDDCKPLLSGAVAILCSTGRLAAENVEIHPSG